MNNYERKYVNELMKNNYLESEREDPKIIQKGGSHNEPYGGFPPIYLCNNSNIISENDNKNREYNKHKNALSIKQIMENRKKNKPFFNV